MLQKIRFFDKKDPKLSLSELLSWMTRIQIYSYGLTYQAKSLPLQREIGRVALP
jgi:hypothetical protein